MCLRDVFRIRYEDKEVKAGVGVAQLDFILACECSFFRIPCGACMQFNSRVNTVSDLRLRFILLCNIPLSLCVRSAGGWRSPKFGDVWFAESDLHFVLNCSPYGWVSIVCCISETKWRC